MNQQNPEGSRGCSGAIHKSTPETVPKKRKSGRKGKKKKKKEDEARSLACGGEETIQFLNDLHKFPRMSVQKARLPPGSFSLILD